MYVQEVEIAKKYHVSAICAAVKSNEVSEIGHFVQQPLSGCWNSHDVTSYAIEYI